MNEEQKQLIKRILLLLTPFTKKIIVILLIMLVSAGIGMILPLIGKVIMDNGLLQKDFPYVVKFACIGFGLILLGECLGLAETRIQAYINAMLPFNLARKAFKHTLNLNLRYFQNTTVTEIMKNIDLDVSNISRIADRSIFFIVMEVFRVIGGICGLIFFINWKLTLLILMIIPLRYFCVKHFAKSRMKNFEANMNHYEDYARWYGDSLRGIREIKLWNLKHLKMREFIGKQRNIINTTIKLTMTDKYNLFSEIIISEFLTYALYILGAYLILKNSLSIGSLFAFITYSYYITGPISSIINIGYDCSNILPSARRLFSFLDLPTPEKSSRPTDETLDMQAVTGTITFNNISFAFKDHPAILKDITFDIKSGEKIAIIGANGTGKSTLLNLLLRFYTPDTGTICLDGIDIHTLNVKNYRKLISVVSQDVYLFNMSIKDNITLFKDMDDHHIYEAARKSRAHEFIETLNARYETPVGVNGSKLSGGQKQKIAFARALAHKSKILILDEATSGYDIESEHNMNELLTTDLKETTIIVVTHRQSILTKLDRIIMLGNNGIMDIGTHEELYGRNEEYRRMVKPVSEASFAL